MDVKHNKITHRKITQNPKHDDSIIDVVGFNDAMTVKRGISKENKKIAYCMSKTPRDYVFSINQLTLNHIHNFKSSLVRVMFQVF